MSLVCISLITKVWILSTDMDPFQPEGLLSLTTGAVTGIIDRLEKAGYVKRVNDPKDRRITIIEPTRNKKLERKLEVIFTPLSMRMHKLLSSYSDNELAFLFDILTKSLEQSHEELMKLRKMHK